MRIKQVLVSLLLSFLLIGNVFGNTEYSEGNCEENLSIEKYEKLDQGLFDKINLLGGKFLNKYSVYNKSYRNNKINSFLLKLVILKVESNLTDTQTEIVDMLGYKLGCSIEGETEENKLTDSQQLVIDNAKVNVILGIIDSLILKQDNLYMINDEASIEKKKCTDISSNKRRQDLNRVTGWPVQYPLITNEDVDEECNPYRILLSNYTKTRDSFEPYVLSYIEEESKLTDFQFTLLNSKVSKYTSDKVKTLVADILAYIEEKKAKIIAAEEKAIADAKRKIIEDWEKRNKDAVERKEKKDTLSALNGLDTPQLKRHEEELKVFGVEGKECRVSIMNENNISNSTPRGISNGYSVTDFIKSNRFISVGDTVDLRCLDESGKRPIFSTKKIREIGTRVDFE